MERRSVRRILLRLDLAEPKQEVRPSIGQKEDTIRQGEGSNLAVLPLVLLLSYSGVKKHCLFRAKNEEHYVAIIPFAQRSDKSDSTGPGQGHRAFRWDQALME